MALSLLAKDVLPADSGNALLVGRVWSHANGGPCVVLVTGETVRDISALAPTTSMLMDLPDLANRLRDGESFPELGPLQRFLDGVASDEPDGDRLLSPCDLQVLKAAGVTFANSMLERVIEERADGDYTRAHAIREQIEEVIGGNLAGVRAGSPEAAEVKALLIEMGYWSQYLEVGIGPDAEVFTKAPVMSSVGTGADIGIHRMSDWNNPEPEVVLIVNSAGRIAGATLGNDVNLRDVEGRSALLLSKAKDNNASASVGPFIRVLDDGFTVADIESIKLDLKVTGEDEFVLEGRSLMSEISRSPEDLVRQTINEHHQYPDGFALYLGTLFAPTEDRNEPGKGFTHDVGDVVRISCDELGALVNEVRHSHDCPPWTFGVSALMTNLARRGLLGGTS